MSSRRFLVAACPLLFVPDIARAEPVVAEEVASSPEDLLPPATATCQWHYVFGSTTIGPLDDRAFAAAYIGGSVKDDTPVWCGGGSWIALRDSPRFAELDRWYTRRANHVVGPLSRVELLAALERTRAEGRDLGELEVRLAWSEWVTVEYAAPLSSSLAEPAPAVPVATPADEAPAPSDHEAPPEAPPTNENALVTITPRVGVAFPGQATPREIARTRVGFGFPVQLDLSVAPADHFEIGSYLHYSARGIEERGDAPTAGQWMHLVSVGVTAKVRFATSDRSRLRLGVLLGYNHVRQGFENEVAKGTITAGGLNVGPSVEWSRDLTAGTAFNVQLAAITQVYGKADIGPLGALVEGGSEQRMPFAPLAFLAVGIDFCVGERP